MQSSTATSIHEAHPTPFNTGHRRSSSYSADLQQDSSPAGRPFAFVPKRRSSGTTPARQGEDSSACPSPPQGQIRLVEKTASEDSATPQTAPRNFCTFPRIKPELSRGRVPQIGTELLGSTLSSDAPPEMDVSKIPAVPSPDQPEMPPLSYPAPAALPEGCSFAILPRKKSGELVKPSLKSTGFATWAASGTGRARTKSAPTTPVGSKSVHFDAHLEHVKLFLSEQKPLAVSRDGSPTETSEGDTTDTSFPFPRMTGVTLRLKPIILPQPPSEPWTFDVRLEKLTLEGTTLVGQVLVRNVAFTKWVAIRFTLDSWQTTSEVAARHLASIRDNTFDRFEFRVRLVDYMNGIEFKRLVFCFRFSVEGQQMWDSNGGRNYEVGFEKVREDPARETDAPALVTDLRKQLELFVLNVPGGGSLPTAASLLRKKPRGLRVWLGDHASGDDDDDDTTSPLRPRSRSPSPLDDQKKTSGTPSLSNKDVPLSARYDFGASLRSPTWIPPHVNTMSPTPSSTTPRPKVIQRRPWSPPPPTSATPTVQFPRASQHRRGITFPSGGSPTGSPYESGIQGSPRDSADFGGERAEGDDACDEDRPRRHTRGWVRGSSFEQNAGDKSPIKKTLPGMPMVIPPTPSLQGSGFHSSGEGSSSSSPCSPSISPSTSNEPFDTVWRTVRRNDDEHSTSTPSFSTSSSTPTSVSPLSPHEDLPQAASHDSSVAASAPGRSNGQRPPINSTPYYSFLDQFCFFTGATNYYPHLNNISDRASPRQVQTASSTVEDYFSQTPPHNDDVQSPHSSASVSPSDPTNHMRSPIPDFSSSYGLMTSS